MREASYGKVKNVHTRCYVLERYFSPCVPTTLTPTHCLPPLIYRTDHRSNWCQRTGVSPKNEAPSCLFTVGLINHIRWSQCVICVWNHYVFSCITLDSTDCFKHVWLRHLVIELNIRQTNSSHPDFDRVQLNFLLRHIAFGLYSYDIFVCADINGRSTRLTDNEWMSVCGQTPHYSEMQRTLREQEI